MRVVITGASRGIGRATALKLAADGARALTLCDVAYLDELEALAGELRGLGLQGEDAAGRHGEAQGAGQGDRYGRQGDGRHRRHRRQCRHRRAGQAGRSRGRGLGPPVQHQPARQLAAGQGRPSASAEVEGRHRHGVVDVRRHAAASDRRLQPGQGGADHADRDDGHGMGARRHPRQRRLSGLRAYLDDRGDLQPAQAGAKRAPRSCRSAGSPRRATLPTSSPSC